MIAMRKIKVVVFDVGETLINEDRMWRQWAIYLGTTPEALLNALYRAIERREHHHAALRVFHPNLDVKQAYAEITDAGKRTIFDKTDLYCDALPSLEHLRSRGYRVGIAGNQPFQAEAALRDCGFETDFTASSARWGVEKPDPVFFEKIQHVAGVNAGAIAYVGDRLDNDILPARAAGMIGIFIERGPWGRTHATWPDAAKADFRVSSLTEIATKLE